MSTPAFKQSLQMGWNETACRELIRRGSKSFYAASLLLPQRVRKPAYALYAFCRLSDDAVDAKDAPADAVARLRERLDLAYADTPKAIPADQAFADMVKSYAMPKALPEALLEGLEWDSEGWGPETFSDVCAYSARVASAVGAMMTVIMGVRDPGTLARACDLGVAMQLTNIARDVGEDARNGRIYLPRQWLREAGVDPEAFLANPVFDARIAACVERLLGEAESLYDRSLAGIGELPADCRPAIHAARKIYREIGRKLAQQGYNSVDQRAVVSKGRKLALLGEAMKAAVWPAPTLVAPPLDETRFLVEAVPSAPQPGTPSTSGDVKSVERAFELLEELANRERAQQMAGRQADGSPSPSQPV
ncbi:MAG: phytoene/squalene synthase family protein [Pseudomonadota bacterium]